MSQNADRPPQGLERFGIEVGPKQVMLHETFMEDHFHRLKNHRERPSLIINCPYCDHDHLVVIEIPADYLAGIMKPISMRKQDAESVEMSCPECGAYFFGSIAEIEID